MYINNVTVCVQAYVYLDGDVFLWLGSGGNGEVDGLVFDDAATDVLEREELVPACDVAALSTHLQDKVRDPAVEGQVKLISIVITLVQYHLYIIIIYMYICVCTVQQSQ